MSELIRDKKEIDNILNGMTGKKLVFTRYYRLRLAERGLEHSTVENIFPQFDKVFAIEKDQLKFGDTGYELFYQMSNNVTFSIAIIPRKDRLEIVHAVEYKRNLSKRLRQK